MRNIAKLIVMAALIPPCAATAQSSQPQAPFTISPETTSVFGPDASRRNHRLRRRDQSAFQPGRHAAK